MTPCRLPRAVPDRIRRLNPCLDVSVAPQRCSRRSSSSLLCPPRCGDVDDGSTPDRCPAADAYTLTGDFGSEPAGRPGTAELKPERRRADRRPSTTGTGAKLADGDNILVNYWVGNGFTEKTALDTFGPDALALNYTVGQQPAPPTSQDPAAVARYLLDSFVSTQIEADDTVGTRKAVTVSSANVVGFGGGALDIGNDDGLLVVIDIDSVVLDGPDGDQQPRSPGCPRSAGQVASPPSLDFARPPSPTASCTPSVLVKGTGDAVKIDDLIVVNYLGQRLRRRRAVRRDLRGDGHALARRRSGQGAVVKGWDQALVGRAGRLAGDAARSRRRSATARRARARRSRGGSTLYFVIDILAAA